MLFILSLRRRCGDVLKSHQRSWWIVHIQPTKMGDRRSPRITPTQRLCGKFVVRPSGGSLYLGFRLITNFRLKAELRTSCFHTVSQLVDRSYPAYKNWRPHVSPNPTNAV